MVFFVVAFGVQFTSSSVIGNMIGAGDVKGVHKYIRANIAFAVFYGAMAMAFLNYYEDVILSKYAHEPETINLMKNMMLCYSFTLFMMIFKDILFGVIVGLGLQDRTTKMTISINFFVWIVIMYLITFHLGFHNQGPWISLSL